MKNNIKKYINIILFLLIIFILYLLLGKNNIKENFKLTSNKYIIITTSLIERNFEERKIEYIKGITSVLNRCKDNNYIIIIVENNGKRETFLDEFNIPVLYTNNNNLDTENKGVKELYDVLECIDTFNIQDEDFIIKMTGRYLLNEKSLFFDICDRINNTEYDTVIKYGWWENPSSIKINDCITGLIGLRCKYIKKINRSKDNKDPIEWEWAKITIPINDDKVKIIDNLGIYIKPANDYLSYILI